MSAERNVREYFSSVADARFVIRRAARIVDEIAKGRDLDPLEHQALIQIYGARAEVLVRTVACRLDIAPTFASKLVKTLIELKLVTSHASPSDLRASLLRVTAAGVRLLQEIDAEVRLQVNMFARGLKPEQKAAALAIFSFYVGAKIEITDYREFAEIPFPAPRAKKTERRAG